MSTPYYWLIPGLKKSVPVVNRFLILSNQQKFNKIFDNTCNVFWVRPDRVRSKARDREYVDVRHCICFIASQTTSLSTKKIGELLGNRDHSTVINSCMKFMDIYETDLGFKNSVVKVCKRIDPCLLNTLGLPDLVDESKQTLKYKILNVVKYNTLDASNIKAKLTSHPEYSVQKCIDYMVRSGNLVFTQNIKHTARYFSPSRKGLKYLERCT